MSRWFIAVALPITLSLAIAACATNDEGPVAIESGVNNESGATSGPGANGPTDPTGPTNPTGPTATDAPATEPSVDPLAQGVPMPDSSEAFGWQELSESSVQDGSIEVPIDYANPEVGTIDLYIARRLATDPDKRIGSLLVNPGGPGFGGSDFAVYAEQIFGEALLEHFDIVGWDPRGTGLSEPAIDCVDDYDEFFAGTDITPDDDGERQLLIDLAEEFQTACVDGNAEIMQFVGTNNSARDMDAIRAALGEQTISYFGFSYGSELGATWATLFPDTVRAAVLDGASDPTASFVESGLHQSTGFEQALATFLSRCSDDSDCAFHNDGDAEGAFDSLMAGLDEQPIPSEPDRPDLTRSMALVGVAQSMYSETFWPRLETALDAAGNGDGSELLGLYDMYFQRRPDGTYDNSLEAFQTISCMDEAERLTVDEEDATADDFNAVAPRFAPGTTGGYFCTFFPEAQDPRIAVTGAGAGPIVVVGTTGDPATPLSSTEAMAASLEDGVLVVVVADQHTGYGVNECSYDAIHDYLIGLSVPDDNTRCE